MRKLVMIPVLLTGMLLGLMSCLSTDSGGNYNVMTNPAVVSYNVNKGGPTLLTAFEEYATPSLATDPKLERGDCIIAQFKLDWDNQPSTNYYTATEISYNIVDQSRIRIQEEMAEEEDLIPVTIAESSTTYSPMTYSPMLNGKMFIIMNYDAPVKQDLDFQLIAISSSESDVKDIYLRAKKVNQPEGKADSNTVIHAFDIKEAISTLGRDTTIKNNSVDYKMRLLKANLKYYKGVDAAGAPVYVNVSTGPLEFTLYN